MKFNVLFVGMLIGVVISGNAFGWGLPSLPGLPGLPGIGGGSSSSASDPDAFLAKAQASEQLVNKSADLLFGLVASKEELAKIEEIKSKMNATTDPQEQKALAQQKMDSELVEISKACENKNLEVEARGWDDKKKAQGTAALFNLALGSKMAADLVPQGQGIISSLTSNPMMVMKLGSLKDAVQCIGGIASGAARVLTAIPPIFSAAKIDVELPKSSTDQPKAIDL